MPSAHPILFYHEPLPQRVRLAQIHCPPSYICSHPSDLRRQLLRVPGQQVQEGGGQVGSIRSQRQHTAGHSPTEPHALPQIRSRADPGPCTQKLPTTLSPGPAGSHTGETPAQQTLTLWTEGAREGKTQSMPAPGEEEPEPRAFTARAKETRQLALTCPTCLFPHLFLLSTA